MPSYDALVLGGGHNSLVAALYLARAGKKVLVLEKNADVGGCIRSGEATRPGYVHDLYSTNMNLFLASPVWAELKDDLGRHGLRFVTSDHPYCNLFPGGQSLRVYTSTTKTLDALRAHNPKDAEGWQALYDQFQTFRKTLLPLYATPLPSAQAAAALAKALPQGVHTLEGLARIVLASTRALGDAYFDSPEAKALIATWGLHLDFGPDVSGGGMFPFLEAFSDMEEGISIVEGGASKLVEALRALVEEAGGEVRTHAEVTAIQTEGGRASGVTLASGETIAARECVVAGLTPRVLFGKLVPPSALPGDFRAEIDRFQYGPATMMVHLALDGPAPWRAGEEIQKFAYVHLAPYVDDLARTYTQAQNGLLPDSPLLIVGQTTAVDPSRTPDGAHLLWIQVRALPREIRSDATGAISATTWKEAAAPFAERVIDKLEAYAPGLRDRIVGRHVVSPADLEQSNPNLVGGDSVGGSHHLHQNFLWRPVHGWSRYKMPLDGLYMTGAGTWPGGGNNATSGYLAAQEILRPGAKAVLGTAAAGAAGLAALAALRHYVQRE